MVGTDIGLLCHCNEARLGLLLGENVAGVAVRVVPQWAEIVRRSERTLEYGGVLLGAKDGNCTGLL